MKKYIIIGSIIILFLTTSITIFAIDLKKDTENTKKVMDMRGMFFNAKSFNQKLNKWETKNCLDMSAMFACAENFNQNINSWNTENVITMHGMFAHALKFNNPLNKWNVEKVEDMTNMFAGAKSFNQPLNKWKLYSIKIIHGMFQNAESFNQNISNWNLGDNVLYRDIFTGSAMENNKPLWNINNGTILLFKNEKVRVIGDNIVYTPLLDYFYMKEIYFVSAFNIDTHYAFDLGESINLNSFDGIGN